MSVDFRTVDLGELGSFKNGANFNKNDAGKGCPVMSVKQLFQGRFVNTNDLGSIKLGTLKRLDDYLVRKNDLIFARSSLKAEGSGQVAIVNKYPENCVFSGFTIRFRVHDEDQINPMYLYYLLRSPKYREIFVRITTGSVISNLTQATLSKIPVDVPPKKHQDAIVKIFDDLDTKVELNSVTNQTLEHIAQAIFKSWFVDFEPTRAKISAKQAGQDPERAAMAAISGKTVAELDQLDAAQLAQLKTTAALFPDGLVESELGEVPEGWEVKTFGEVSNCYDSKRIPLSKKKREEKKPGNIPYHGATSIMDYINEWIFNDTFLLLGEDGSVIKDDGTPFVQYIWGKTWVNNHAHVLQGTNGVSTEQLMLFIKSQNIAAYITGAVQLKLNQRNMNSIPFIDAGEGINSAFFELIEPFYREVKHNIEATETLEKLRDTLLPKLLSGELSPTTTEAA